MNSAVLSTLWSGVVGCGGGFPQPIVVTGIAVIIIQAIVQLEKDLKEKRIGNEWTNLPPRASSYFGSLMGLTNFENFKGDDRTSSAMS